nr:immunoglobulin heavy chain junction region [Mus musculus]
CTTWITTVVEGAWFAYW